jgi:hypothetical protein
MLDLRKIQAFCIREKLDESLRCTPSTARAKCACLNYIPSHVTERMLGLSVLLLAAIIAAIVVRYLVLIVNG